MADYPFHPKCEGCGSESAGDYRLVLFRRTSEDRRADERLRVSGIYCNKCEKNAADKYGWGREVEWVPDMVDAEVVN